MKYRENREKYTVYNEGGAFMPGKVVDLVIFRSCGDGD